MSATPDNETEVCSQAVYHESESLLHKTNNGNRTSTPSSSIQYNSINHDQDQISNASKTSSTFVTSTPGQSIRHNNYTNNSGDSEVLDSELEVNSDDDDYDQDDENEDNGLSPRELRTEFQTMPFGIRPNYKLLFAGLAIFITGASATIPSLLDALVFLICKHDFNDNNSPNNGNNNNSNLPTPINAFMAMAQLAHSSAHNHSPNNDNGLAFNDPRCFAPQITAAVGMFQSYQTMINAFFGAITIPLISSLSDRFGRKPAFIWSISCTITNLFITLICTSFPEKFSYKLILLGSVIDGIGGGVLIMSVLTSSYISDCVREKYRAPILSISDAIVYGGLAIGPFLGSMLLSATNHSIVLLFSLSILLESIFLFIIIFLLPESRSERARRKSISQFNNFSRKNSTAGSVSRSRSGSVLFDDDSETHYSRIIFNSWLFDLIVQLKDGVIHPLRSFRLSHIPRHQSSVRANVYILLGVTSTIVEIGTCAAPFIFLYAKTQFHWTSVENGYFVSVLGGSRFLFLALVLPFVLEWFRKNYDHSPRYVDKSDKLLLQIGFLASILCYVLISEARNGGLFLSAAVLFAFGSGGSPILRNALIKHAESGKVGELLGLSQFISRILSIFIPPMIAIVYNKTVSYRPQLILELFGSMYFIMLVLVCFLRTRHGHGHGHHEHHGHAQGHTQEHNNNPEHPQTSAERGVEDHN